MKKVLLSALVLALPALASAQVQLISGYNFGQFIGSGYPALDGATGDAVGSIGANWTGSTPPPLSSSGDFVGANATTGNFSVGNGRAYWDGTGGSSVYNNTNGADIVAAENTSFVINNTSVHNMNMAQLGDNTFNLGLRSNVAGNRIAFVQDTTGFSDFDPLAFSQPNDFNMTFSAQAIGTPVTINWYLNGSATSFASTVVGTTAQAFSLDLDASFYGNAAATLAAEIGSVGGSGQLMFDNVQFNGVVGTVIPEPSTYAAILGVVTLGIAAVRRRKNAFA